MPKGWTIEMATENTGRWGNTVVCLQAFDVAIEDRLAAENAVRQRAGTSAVLQTSRERSFPGLSPGRVKSRPSILISR